MSEKHQCEGRVRYGDWGRSRPCTKAGAYEHEGKHYCKTHHPPSIKERDVARHDAWMAKWDEEKKQRATADASAAEQRRRAQCFPELLEALKACLDKGSRWHPCDPVVIAARAAIAKAEGQQ